MPTILSPFTAFIDSIQEWLFYFVIILLAAGLGFFGLMIYLQFNLAVFLSMSFATSLPLLCLGTLAALLTMLVVQRLFLAAIPSFVC